jgi:hypothetical protein
MAGQIGDEEGLSMKWLFGAILAACSLAAGVSAIAAWNQWSADPQSIMEQIHYDFQWRADRHLRSREI